MQITYRKSFLIKTGLVLAAGLLILTTAWAVNREGNTALDLYRQWERGQLYPAKAERESY